MIQTLQNCNDKGEIKAGQVGWCTMCGVWMHLFYVLIQHCRNVIMGVTVEKKDEKEPLGLRRVLFIWRNCLMCWWCTVAMLCVMSVLLKRNFFFETCEFLFLRNQFWFFALVTKRQKINLWLLAWPYLLKTFVKKYLKKNNNK